MATFQRRARKDGKVSVTASIRIKKEGVIIHQENKTVVGHFCFLMYN